MEPHNPPWQRGASANDGFSFRPPPIFLPATPDAADRSRRRPFSEGISATGRSVLGKEPDRRVPGLALQ